ncbi:MAG: flagellar basal body rod protein FlgB [Desulfobacterales bacterium]|nr:flagellar basal body rod protein FlgB [Desulfobacterales bacterium]
MPETFDSTYNIMEKALNILSQRNKIISGNIANMDTVGYKPKDLDFKKTLEKELQNPSGNLYRTNNKHFQSIDSFHKTVISDNGTNDTVDIDKEMSNLLENNIMYRSTVEMLLRKMTMVKHAITEGGR